MATRQASRSGRLAQPQGKRRLLDARLTQPQVQVVGGGVGTVADHHPRHFGQGHGRVVVGRDEPPLFAQFSDGPPVRAQVEVGQVEALQVGQWNRFQRVEFAGSDGFDVGHQGDDLGHRDERHGRVGVPKDALAVAAKLVGDEANGVGRVEQPLQRRPGRFGDDGAQGLFVSRRCGVCILRCGLRNGRRQGRQAQATRRRERTRVDGGRRSVYWRGGGCACRRGVRILRCGLRGGRWGQGDGRRRQDGWRGHRDGGGSGAAGSAGEQGQRQQQ